MHFLVVKNKAIDIKTKYNKQVLKKYNQFKKKM